jgi:NADPH-dependent ferric siderophore reductase
MENHKVERVRNHAMRRTLQVSSKHYVTPRMLRIVFHSQELQTFASFSPDDFVKIFIPVRDETEEVVRYFTPRAWDTMAGTLVLDFALHGTGPAIEWALKSKAGDALEIDGPPASTIVSDDFDWYLLVGDATALPAIGRRLESLRPNVPVRVIALVADSNEQQTLPESALCKIEWFHSSGDSAQDASTVRSAVKGLRLPPGDGFVWIAAEAATAREVYKFAVETLQHPKQWIKAAAYWSHGLADARQRFT